MEVDEYDDDGTDDVERQTDADVDARKRRASVRHVPGGAPCWVVPPHDVAVNVCHYVLRGVERAEERDDAVVPPFGGRGSPPAPGALAGGAQGGHGELDLGVAWVLAERTPQVEVRLVVRPPEEDDGVGGRVHARLDVHGAAREVTTALDAREELGEVAAHGQQHLLGDGGRRGRAL